MPDQIKKKETEKTKKQNPEEVKEDIRQASEFEKKEIFDPTKVAALIDNCLLYTSPSPRDLSTSRMPSSA